MNKFQAKAAHNQGFLDCIESTYPDSFFDWKITVVFYISIHLLKALANKRGKDIGETHEQIFGSLDQKRGIPIMQIPPGIFKIYKAIYRYSKTSRYDGIEQDFTLISLKADYNEVLKLRSAFCSYMESQGIEI